MSADLQSGPSAALKVFVIACFAVWATASYLALFALGSVFWVAVLESRFHHGALAEYIVAAVATIASALVSVRLWKRVYETPRLYPKAAKAFALVIGFAAAASAAVAAWHAVRG